MESNDEESHDLASSDLTSSGLASARLQAYIAENARMIMAIHALPPFTLFLDQSARRDGDNFAMPDLPIVHDVGNEVGKVEDALRQLAELCAARALQPQIRFVQEYAPALPRILPRVGYGESGRWPLLLCTPQSYQAAPAVAGLAVATVAADSPLADVKEGLDANALGFDPNAALTTLAEAAEFRQRLGNALAFTARLFGQAVGAGMFNPIYNGVTEVVGITTLTPFRGRGIASYLTAFATRAAFAQGAEMVFLIPANAQANRLYARVGYHFLTNLLIYQQPKLFPAR